MEYDDGFEFPQLLRAAECLAFAGSSKSLPYIKKIAAQHIDNEMVLNVCQTAFEYICKREKIPIAKDGLFYGI